MTKMVFPYIMTVICLCAAIYGWSNSLSGWGWWLLGMVLLYPTSNKSDRK